MMATGQIPDDGAAMSRGVRFLLGFARKMLDPVDPTLTVLDYLRSIEGRCGTKEGCAEGDCGACTVVLGTAQDGRMQYRCANACILFVPALDGKQLITVEDLDAGGDALHPVQQAMAECHASQCGFCTPGIVMSLFAWFHDGPKAHRRDIDDALAGNLCRCTGYRPIIEAAQALCGLDRADRFSAREAETLETLGAIARAGSIEITDGTRRTFAPKDLDELAAICALYPNARFVAGGTDLGLVVTKELRDPETLIYLGNVAGLNEVSINEQFIEVGAAVSIAEARAAIAAVYPDFDELLRRFGSPQIRNVATLGGNVANASPIGDSMPALIALGATVLLRGGGNRRELALEDFYVAYRRTALRQGEYVERIRIPTPADGRVFHAYKISKRFDQDISSLCGAFCLTREDGVVRDLRISIGGMAAVPKRARACESQLIGQRWSKDAIDDALPALDRDYDPISDFRASRRYRQLAARNLLRKFFMETSGSDVSTRVIPVAESAS